MKNLNVTNSLNENLKRGIRENDGRGKLGVLSGINIRLRKARPFQSEPLDRLAEVMQVSNILKKDKAHRYYKVDFLPQGCLSCIDTVFFDAKYYDMLLPEELLAVGAHEFNHIINRHDIKRFARTLCPPIAVATIIGLLVFANSESMNTIYPFSNLGVSLLMMVACALFFSLVIPFYANAKWHRQQETHCDLSAVKFANGEALISALIKLNKLRPEKPDRFSQFLPVTYPTLEQRIKDIRVAADRKSTLSS